MDLEKKLFEAYGGFNNHKFKHQIKKNKDYIKLFCNKYNVKLLSVSSTIENSCIEPAYLFSDDLGHYTIEGIKKSLFDILSYSN
ncbi:MAG: hypothetical protein AABX44_00900 [Nanoarchaeota archaeon]